MTDLGFQRPRYLECNYDTLTSKYGSFSAQPFERGFGITIGNSLRRILLSSIPGAAITNIRIQGVLHEFSSISGVLEDVTDIILSLKSLPLKLLVDEPKTMTLKKEGSVIVTAADIEHDSDIEILDEGIHIATLDNDGKLDMEMIVENKRGYIPADQNFNSELSVDYIPIDSSHSPVIKVNYKVDPARVGKRIDYESLFLEVWTNGAISPKDSLAKSSKIMRDHLVIFLNIVDEPAEREQTDLKAEIPYFPQIDILSKSIDHLELSVRSNNCLKSAGIDKISELVQKSEDELLKTKNFGRKSLTEIKETLQEMGLGLNLELHPSLLENLEEEEQVEPEEGEEE